MDAVILVDLQNDFLPGGALAVPAGNEVIPVANRLLKQFELVVATQDWHPVNHVSFAANHPGKSPGEHIEANGLLQVLWPIHCVQDTRGAGLAADLEQTRIRKLFPKGTDPRIDSYSGFYDNGHMKSTGLGEFLKLQGVGNCYIMGLATDYCVKFTALDARSEDFETYLVLDGCRGVELAVGDVQRSIDEMAKSGVEIVYSHEIAV
ncbi:MAG TPA: bifunctional nicotinamidase/pyrazinamidase [Terriglobia bacterium]|nr:bifunctional nicotinamidase/pyrazinamidase [Terriglobia bacterium]